jgi:alpha-mannosidase
MNAVDSYYGYPNAWLSGKGRHHLEYALLPHEGEWASARIPQQAWEYNQPVVTADGCGSVSRASFLKTSGNLIVEALRRDGADLEMRLVEAFDKEGKAEVTLDLPHTSASLTDFTGARATALQGGPTYTFPIRPQQIVTLRFRTAAPVPEIKPLLKWDTLVPEQKQKALQEYLPDKKGHSPRGS